MPEYLYPIAGAVLGLIIGSFLAALVSRWPRGQSIVKGRSRCDHCGHKLKFWELVPVFSFALQSGKCSKCAKPISIDHLAIELAAGLVGAVALYVAPGPAGLAGALFGWFLLALAALDVRHFWLPDKLTYSLAAFGLLASLVIENPDFLSRLIGGLSGTAFLGLVAFVYKKLRHREGLGGGDPKMLGAIGCWLGWEMLPLVLLGAAVIGLLSVVTQRFQGAAITDASQFPFGSFIAIVAFPLWVYQTGSGSALY